MGVQGIVQGGPVGPSFEEPTTVLVHAAGRRVSVWARSSFSRICFR
jgi:hypothetical protein